MCSPISADTNNVISQIETEYLVDYYYKIGNADKEGNFFASLLRNKVCKQKKLRFGIFPERVIIGSYTRNTDRLFVII